MKSAYNKNYDCKSKTNISYNKRENIFISILYEKRFAKRFRDKLKARKKYKKLKKYISNWSPTIDDLNDIADLVKFAELVYSYENNIFFSPIYSSKNYDPNTNGFIINSPYYRNLILVKLDLLTSTVLMEIRAKRETDGGYYQDITECKLLYTIKFVNNNWVETPECRNELLVDMLIEIISSAALEVFDYCYHNNYSKFIKNRDDYYDL